MFLDLFALVLCSSWKPKGASRLPEPSVAAGRVVWFKINVVRQ
jgi:hypothetical protein